jgi:protein-tyrosine phosphatase
MTSVVDQIDGHSLMRGARPSSFAEMDSIDALTFINLEEGWFEAIHLRNQEEDMWFLQIESESYVDMDYFAIPMSDIFPPSAAQLKTIVALLQKQLKKGNVYVHCLHGVDRTGMVIAAYDIIAKGRSADVAIKNMLDQGFHKFPYLYWLPTLRSLEVAAVVR